jgi:hypothetical protein
MTTDSVEANFLASAVTVFALRNGDADAGRGRAFALRDSALAHDDEQPAFGVLLGSLTKGGVDFGLEDLEQMTPLEAVRYGFWPHSLDLTSWRHCLRGQTLPSSWSGCDPCTSFSQECLESCIDGGRFSFFGQFRGGEPGVPGSHSSSGRCKHRPPS